MDVPTMIGSRSAAADTKFGGFILSATPVWTPARQGLASSRLRSLFS